MLCLTEDEKVDVCIYGMGNHGINTFFDLYEYGIRADYFSDADAKKHGDLFNGIKCISYDELLECHKDVFIIVAIYNAHNLVEHFKEVGFKRVMLYTDALNLFKQKYPRKKMKPIQDVGELLKLKQEIYDWLYCKGEFPLDKHYDGV